ncbi:hypothetical protein PRO82_000650 [Candidatus Protochlamydia amoebophila]|nr:hypothetical protein [Candidatus Protochlamydia amoebophila]
MRKRTFRKPLSEVLTILLLRDHDRVSKFAELSLKKYLNYNNFIAKKKDMKIALWQFIAHIVNSKRYKNF